MKERVRGNGSVCRGTNGKGTVCDCLSACGVDFSVPLLAQEPTFLVSKAPDKEVSDTEVLLEDPSLGREQSLENASVPHLLCFICLPKSRVVGSYD